MQCGKPTLFQNLFQNKEQLVVHFLCSSACSSATLLNIFSSKLYYQQMMEEEEKVKKSDLSETLRILNENEDILNVGLEFCFLHF